MKGFNGNVVNLTFHSINEGDWPQNTSIVPLIEKYWKENFKNALIVN